MYISAREQVNKLRRENEFLKAKLEKAEADTDYIAMMCEVELETEQEEQENEQV